MKNTFASRCGRGSNCKGNSFLRHTQIFLQEFSSFLLFIYVFRNHFAFRDCKNGIRRGEFPHQAPREECLDEV